MMKSGGWGMALILLIAVCRVAVTSGFAGLLKPMWLSLICTNVKSADLPAVRSALFANARDTGMPPLIVQTRPVPAHAMHFRNPRRSMPSSLRSCKFWSIRSRFFSAICPPFLLPSEFITRPSGFYSRQLERKETSASIGARRICLLRPAIRWL